MVSKLLTLVLRASGAEFCLLVLVKDDLLCAEATNFSGTDEVTHIRSTQSIDRYQEHYPCSIINYVARTRTAVVNDISSIFTPTTEDPYFSKRGIPDSVLAIPLLNQSQVG